MITRQKIGFINVVTGTASRTFTGFGFRSTSIAFYAQSNGANNFISRGMCMRVGETISQTCLQQNTEEGEQVLGSNPGKSIWTVDQSITVTAIGEDGFTADVINPGGTFPVLFCAQG